MFCFKCLPFLFIIFFIEPPLTYLYQWQQVTQSRSENPFTYKAKQNSSAIQEISEATREGGVRGDGESEAHDDVGDRHVDQVQPGVQPQLTGSQ